MRFDPNSLFYYMAKTYSDNKTDDNKIIFCNEGSSRSSKTFDAIHLIYAFCDQNRNLKIPLRIGCFRNTLKDSREKLYYDFKTCLKEMEVYDSNSAYKENQSPEYFLFGNKLEFRGLDEDTEQVGYDIVFVNEALEVDIEEKISGLKMRCTRLMIFDWNPKYTQHWIFNWEGQKNILFTKTTYKNNKHLKQSVISEIESKSPWNLDDLKLTKKERRPHEENILNKTANEWYFEVYGMGLRANRDGLVFPDVTWIYEWPKEYDYEYYGLDFGFTQDPSAFTHVAFKVNKERKHDLYLWLKIYEPTKDSDILVSKMELVEPKLKDFIIYADSASPLMIADIRRKQYNIFEVAKPPGSILYGIDLMNRFNIHIMYDKNAKAEQENYCYKKIHGIQVNEPVDGFNHFWDSARYVCMSMLRRYLNN